MKQLTDELIISELNKRLSHFNIFTEGYLHFIILAIVIVIILLSIKKLRDYGLVCLIFAGFFIISIFITPNTDYIKYSIDNKTWSVITDCIVDKEFKVINHKKKRMNTHYYYIYLKENGKVSVSSSTYHNNYIGEEVYVVLLEDETGKKYISDLIYSQKTYTYINETNKP